MRARCSRRPSTSRRHGRSRTRSGSARRAGRRSACGREGRRRTPPGRRNGNATRARGPRRRGRAATGSRLRTRADTPHARPRTRRDTRRCARFPARRCPRSARAPSFGRGSRPRANSTMLGMTVRRLAELLEARGPCVVLTGAGISTESGIPDFRSPSGIWAQYDPMEYATIDAFLEDPVKVWDFYGKRVQLLRDAEPNDGHRALAELEDRGWVHAVITQNVDRLHERAGTHELVEVHGSIS